jgi:hypothetical protein
MYAMTNVDYLNRGAVRQLSHVIKKPSNQSQFIFRGQIITIHQQSLLSGGIYLNGSKIIKTGDRPSIKGYFPLDGNELLFLESTSPDGTVNDSLIIIKANGNVFSKYDFSSGYWKPKIIAASSGAVKFYLSGETGVDEKYYIYSLLTNSLVNYETRLANPAERMLHIKYTGELFYVNGRVESNQVYGSANYLLVMDHKKIFYGAGCVGKYSQKSLLLWPVPKNMNQLMAYGEGKYLVSYGCPRSGVTVTSIRHIAR